MQPWTPSHPRPSPLRRLRNVTRRLVPATVWLLAIVAIAWLRQGAAGTAFPGMVDAARAQVAAQDDGRIAAMLISRHQAVTRGQLLARIDDEPLRLRLQQARQQLERLQADRRAQEAELAIELAAEAAAHTMDAAIEHRRLMGDVESARIDALATRADIEETRVRLQGATADVRRIETLAREGLSAESELIRLRTEQDALGKRISELETLHSEQTRATRPPGTGCRTSPAHNQRRRRATRCSNRCAGASTNRRPRSNESRSTAIGSTCWRRSTASSKRCCCAPANSSAPACRC